MAVIAKKKAKPAKKMSEAKLRKLADKALAQFQAEAAERYELAMKVYKQQDSATKDALDRMIDLLCRIARTQMWVGTGTGKRERIVLSIPDQVVRQNMTYMAVEILLDLAQMDVKVEGFRFPDMCVVCKKQVKPKKSKRKVK